MLKTDIEKANKVLNKKCLDQDLYMRIYSFSTENISGYIDFFDLKNKSLLTVGSSGDQVLNSYFNGCRDITLIDINPFSKYYINLKIAGILSLSYQEFQKFFYRLINNYYNYGRYNMQLFKKISSNLKTIDYASFYFFQFIFNNYKRDKISDYLMNDDERNTKVLKKINNYLKDEESFNKFKTILKDVCFKFINEDIFKFQSNVKYDNIFLSNLCTTVNLYQFKDLLVKLNNNNLAVDGKMLIAYLWNTNFYSNEINFDWIQAYVMPATRYMLDSFITEHHHILGINDIICDKNYNSDLVMIYKKKN